MFHWALCKFPKLIKNGSKFWRPGSIINASICKNGGPRTVAFIVENQIREIRCAFFETNILMGIHKLPKMRDYWSVDEGLGNTLIQKTMTRDWFLEILQNLHFADNLQKLPPRESESFDRAWKLRPFFDHLMKHLQEALLPESHQSIDERMCKFKGKSLMRQYMKNKPIKWCFKFWFRCGSKSGCLYQFDMCLGKKI